MAGAWVVHQKRANRTTSALQYEFVSSSLRSQCETVTQKKQDPTIKIKREKNRPLFLPQELCTYSYIVIVQEMEKQPVRDFPTESTRVIA